MSLGRNLKREAGERGWEQVLGDFADARKDNKITQDDMSLKDLATGILGDNWADKLAQAKSNGFHGMEAADAVDASAFVSITGNQLIDTVHTKFNNPEFIGDQLVTRIPVTHGNLTTIKEPWLSDVGIEQDAGTSFIQQQGMPARRTEFSPSYVLLAAPVKKRLICSVTFEMIYADRTRQAIESAGSVGKSLGLAKEYEILRNVLGITNNLNVSYGGAAEANIRTYLKSGTYWSNDVDSTPLTGWADVNTIEQKFAEMRDPVTGVPIVVGDKQLLVFPSNFYNAMNILHATQIRVGDGASLATATYSVNPLGGFKLLPASPHAYKVADDELTKENGSTALTSAETKAVWYAGNFKEAFYWREVYGLKTAQAPVMNPDEFERDIVLSVSASTFGVAGTKNPFQVCRAGGIVW